MLVNIHKYTIIRGCVGKKTALLQTSVVRWLVRFANVLFCAVAVHYIVFSFTVYTLCLFIRLVGNVRVYIQCRLSLLKVLQKTQTCSIALDIHAVIIRLQTQPSKLTQIRKKPGFP